MFFHMGMMFYTLYTLLKNRIHIMIKYLSVSVAAALLSFTGFANAATPATDVSVATSTIIPAHGLKTAGTLGFFVYPNEDLEFLYNKADAKFVLQNVGGSTFTAKLINDDAIIADAFKLEAMQKATSSMNHTTISGKGVNLVATIGGKTLDTATFQELDLTTMGMTGAGLATGVQEFATVPVGIETGTAIGEATQEALPAGDYSGQVAIDFKATWTQPAIP
jgi:hypothetical protein